MPDPSKSADTEKREPSVSLELFWLVAACFFVSGFAALLYETVWLRQFAILLGTSEQALAIVLASYMGGLALGSWIASRWIDSIRRPLLVYGVLELAIAVSALFIPLGILIARSFQASWLGGLPEPPPSGTLSQSVFNFATALFLILIPTTLMGATLPLLARHVVRRDEQVGPRIGMLYAINTAGAVVGTLVAAFLLMPLIGMRATTWVGAIANGIVFVLVLVMARSLPTFAKASEASDHESERVISRSDSEKDQRSPFRHVLWLIGISGGVSFCYEILFTRMLSHLLGGSIYAFATMLAGFLAGIALGGAAASRLATSRKVAAVRFLYAQAATAVCILVAYHTLNAVMGWSWESFGGGRFAFQMIGSVLILLPTATCVGASFPLAVRAFARDEREAASGAAAVYAMSTIGGIVGSLLTAGWLMPLLQYHGTAIVAMLANLSIATLALVVMKLPRVHAVAIFTGLALLLMALPRSPEAVLRISALTSQQTPGKIIYSQVSSSATVSVFYSEGQLVFQTNGLPEARVRALGAGQDWGDSGRWLTTLPPAIRSDLKTMMVIGLGGGGATSNIPPSVKQIDVVELSPAVVEANRAASVFRDRDTLRDDRVRIILNDARNALTLTNRKYDSIVSQPSHPWTAGASHLYTAEFVTLAKEHLNERGLFLQWMGADFIDAGLLGNITATMRSVFKHVQIYEPLDGMLLFVGSEEPFEGLGEGGGNGLPIALEDRTHYLRSGIKTPTHLLAILAADELATEELAKGHAVITDEKNLLAMRAPSLIGAPQFEVVSQSLLDVHPVHRGLAAIKKQCPSFDPPSYLRRLIFTRKDKLAKSCYQTVIADEPPGSQVVVNCLIDRIDGATDLAYTRLLENRDTKHPELAFKILHADLFGNIDPELTADEKSRLSEALHPNHRTLLKVVLGTMRNDLELAERSDPVLATIPVGDIGFTASLIVRLPWRLEKPGPGQLQRCQEVIRLIDDHSAFIPSEQFALFRILAGVKTSQGFISLATAADTANAMDQRQLEQDAPLDDKAFETLQRIALVIANRDFFPSVSRELYRETLVLVNDVLRDQIMRREAAGIPVELIKSL